MVPIVTVRELVMLVLIYTCTEACIDPDTFGGHMGKPVENISKWSTEIILADFNYEKIVTAIIIRLKVDNINIAINLLQPQGPQLDR